MKTDKSHCLALKEHDQQPTCFGSVAPSYCAWDGGNPPIIELSSKEDFVQPFGTQALCWLWGKLWVISPVLRIFVTPGFPDSDFPLILLHSARLPKKPCFRVPQQLTKYLACDRYPTSTCSTQPGNWTAAGVLCLHCLINCVVSSQAPGLKQASTLATKV